MIITSLRYFFLCTLLVGFCACSDSGSPDGENSGSAKRIFYSEWFGDEMRIHSMNADGSDKKLLYSNAYLPHSGPHGDTLFFLRPMMFGNWEMMSGTISGSEPKLEKKFYVTGMALCAVASPNNKYVLLKLRTGWLLHIPEDTSKDIIIDAPAGIQQDLPVFSPDSKTILFSDKDSIIQYDIALQSSTTITSQFDVYDENIQRFDWSPSGSSICYYAPVKGGASTINTLDLGSGRKDTLVPTGNIDNASPLKWSPTGRYLLYQYTALSAGSEIDSLYHYDAETSLSTYYPIPYTYPYFRIQNYDWSEDGTQVVLRVYESDGNPSDLHVRLLLLNISTKQVTDLGLLQDWRNNFFWSRKLPK